jgi:NADH/F420H2 dehydrogenase subunit C
MGLGYLRLRTAQHGSRCVAGNRRMRQRSSQLHAHAALQDEGVSMAPTISSTKSDFSHKIAQITRGNPENAFSVLPNIVNIILDSIPKPILAVAITSIDEESLLASSSEEPLAAIQKGALPQVDLVFSVKTEDIYQVMKFLHGHAQLQFKCLVEMTAVDYPERTNGRFEVTYVLWSPTLNARILVKALVGELDAIESVVPIYANANWLERETWDMFGVFFKNHPDLRRLLTDYGFTHHPLRKDFPVQGYTEVFYSESRKAVTTRTVQLAQTQRVVAGDN